MQMNQRARRAFRSFSHQNSRCSTESLEARRLLAATAALESQQLETASHGAFCGCPLCNAIAANIEDSLPYGNDGLGGQGRYQLASRWSTTASGSTGSTGSGMTLTYSIVPDGTTLTSGAGEAASTSVLQARLNAIYGSSATWLPIIQSVFNSWSAISGITYIYEPNDDGVAMSTSSNAGSLGVRGDVRIGAHPIDGANNILAYNYYPSAGGDMTLDSNDLTLGGYMFNTTNNSRRLRNVMAHEHGHGLGIAHVEPVTQTKLMEPFVTTVFDGPQFDDMLAVQRFYGDFYEKGTGNGAAVVATDRGTLGNGTDNITNVAISTTNDKDFYRFAITTGKKVTINLTPFGTPYSQGPQGGTYETFDPSAQADLRLDLIAADGTTVLFSSNATGVGGSESITIPNLDAGTYYIRVQTAAGSPNLLQSYTLATVIANSFYWDGGGDGVNWTDALNWSSDVLPGASDDAVISVAANPTVVLGAGAQSIKSLICDEALTINGGSLSITNASTITGALTLAGGTLTGTGSITLTGAINAWNGGTLTGIGSLVVGPGSILNVASGAKSTDRPLSVDGTIALGVGGTNTLKATSLTINAGGRVNINDNALILDWTGSSPFNATKSQIISGYAAGAWNGLGINSAIAAVTPQRAIGFAESTSAGTFAGLAVDASAVLVRYTIVGDATLDQTVDITDLSALATNWQLTGKSWAEGDFNYDGTVDITDLSGLATNWQTSLAPPLAIAKRRLGTPVRVTTAVLE